MGQPTYLKEDLLTNLINSSTEMAPRSSRPRYFPCRNLFSIDLVKNKLARDPGLVGRPYSGSTSSAPSCNSTPGLTLIPALIFALAPTPIFTNELIKQFMKIYLESNQGPKQPPGECEQIHKATILEVYYDKLHIDYYHFFQ